MAKTKALISFAVTAKLICVFVFAYAKNRFSHDAAQIIRDIDIVDKNNVFTVSTNTKTIEHQYKLFKQRSRLKTRRNLLRNKVVDTWTSLPPSVVETPFINSFKSRLKSRLNSLNSLTTVSIIYK